MKLTLVFIQTVFSICVCETGPHTMNRKETLCKSSKSQQKRQKGGQASIPTDSINLDELRDIRDCYKRQYEKDMISARNLEFTAKKMEERFKGHTKPIKATTTSQSTQKNLVHQPCSEESKAKPLPADDILTEVNTPVMKCPQLEANWTTAKKIDFTQNFENVQPQNVQTPQTPITGNIEQEKSKLIQELQGTVFQMADQSGRVAYAFSDIQQQYDALLSDCQENRSSIKSATRPNNFPLDELPDLFKGELRTNDITLMSAFEVELDKCGQTLANEDAMIDDRRDMKIQLFDGMN